MDEKLKESLSALVDGEAHELEVKRLLSHCDESELVSQWRRYHQIGDGIKQAETTSDWSDFDISGSLRERLADIEMEDVDQDPAVNVDSSEPVISHDEKGHQPAAKRSAHWLNYAAAVGVMALLLVTLIRTDPDTQQSIASAVPSEGQSGSGLEVVSYRPYEVDEKQAKRLSDLMLRHAGIGFMGSGHGVAEYARVANYNPQAL